MRTQVASAPVHVHPCPQCGAQLVAAPVWQSRRPQQRQSLLTRFALWFLKTTVAIVVFVASMLWRATRWTAPRLYGALVLFFGWLAVWTGFRAPAGWGTQVTQVAEPTVTAEESTEVPVSAKRTAGPCDHCDEGRGFTAIHSSTGTSLHLCPVCMERMGVSLLKSGWVLG